MTRIDFEKCDGLIHLDCDRRRGIWAASLLLKGSRTTRNAGSMPTTASAHSLLLAALTNVLRNISKSQIAKLLPRDVSKLRLMVTTRDETFAEALQHLAGMRPAPRLRAGKNFLAIVQRELARFNLTVTVDNDPANLGLLNWAKRSIVDPASLTGWSPSLTATAAFAIV